MNSAPQECKDAYDTNIKAVESCARLALVNGREKAVVVKNECSPSELGRVVSNRKALVICDCEGFEKELFNSDNISMFKDSDLIIETHDFLDATISKTLKNLFHETHNITSIFSLKDLEKAFSYELPKRLELNRLEIWRAVYEGRPAKMEWLICEAK